MRVRGVRGAGLAPALAVLVVALVAGSALASLSGRAGSATPTEGPSGTVAELAPVPAAPIPSAGLATTWNNVTSGVGSAPLPRYGAAATWDAGDHEGVVFGGLGPMGAPLRSTWTFTNGAWANADPGKPSATNLPSERWGSAMGYDATDGYTVLFGGYGGGLQDVLGDTWTFAGGTWANLSSTLSTAPSPRVNASMAWDPALNELVLFGGRVPNKVFNDTWTFAGGNWTAANASPVTPTNTPPARFGAALAFDTALNELVLFGGTGVAGTPLGDVWAYGASGWAPLATNNTPSPRAFASFAQLSNGTDLLFGGVVSAGVLGDTWALTGADWTNLTGTLGAAPSAREGAVMMPAMAANGATFLLLFGGQRPGDVVLGDSWATGADRLAITVGSASPAALDVNHSTTLSIVAFGEAATYSYAWTTLPPGCSGTNAPTLTCTPTSSGRFTVHILVTAAPSGNTANSTIPLLVNGQLKISQFSASPLPATVGGSNIVIKVTTSGGTGVLRYNYSGLPPGCPQSTASTFPCTPTTVGSWIVGVTVTDATNVSTSATTSVVVNAAPGATSGWLHKLESPLGAALVLLIIGVIIIVLFARSRAKESGTAPPSTSTPPPSAPPQPPSPGSPGPPAS